MFGESNLICWQLRWHQIEVRAMPGHHRALSRVVDEYGDRTGGVGLSFDQMRDNLLSVEVFLGKLSETVPSHLADEPRRDSAPTRPDGHICCASPRSQQYFAEGVAAPQQFGIRANQNIPGEVPENAQMGRRRSSLSDLGDGHRHEGICETGGDVD